MDGPSAPWRALETPAAGPAPAVSGAGGGTGLDRRAVGLVDVDPFDLDALVSGGERHPLDVRREGDPVAAQAYSQSLRRKYQSWASVLATITPHTYP